MESSECNFVYSSEMFVTGFFRAYLPLDVIRYIFLPLVPIMYVHGQESGREQDSENGAGNQHEVDGDVHLRVLDQAQGAVFGRIPENYDG